MGIVTRDFSFQLGQLGRHLFVRGDHLTQSHEGPHYKDAHLDGTGAVEHVCRHDRPVLGEGIGRETGVAVPLGTGRNLRPVLRTKGRNNRHTVTNFQPWAGFAAPTRGVCLKVNNFYDLRRFGRALTRALLKDSLEG